MAAESEMGAHLAWGASVRALGLARNRFAFGLRRLPLESSLVSPLARVG